MQNEIFSQELNTQSPIVNNAIITFGDTDVSGKGKHFKSRFIQPGVTGYPGQFGNVLITKETLDKFINTIVGVPVIIKHKDITDKNADEERVGIVNSVWYNPEDGWYWCDGVIWDETAINLIEDNDWSVSCSYNILKADNKGGSENNIPYDMEFLDGVFTHLALVNNPRYERATIVFNSKDVPFFVVYNDSDQDLDDTSTDRWITIHPNGEDAKGRAVLIPEGKTVSEVMKEKYAKWATERKDQKKLFDTKEYKTGISDYKLAKETKKAVDKYGEYADIGQIEEHLKEKYGYKDFLAKDKEDDKKEDIKKDKSTERDNGFSGIGTKENPKQYTESELERKKKWLKRNKDMRLIASGNSYYLNPFFKESAAQKNLQKIERNKELEKKAEEFLKKNPDYNPHEEFIKKQKALKPWKYKYEQANNSTDFAAQFTDIFYQALAEVIVENSLGE